MNYFTFSFLFYIKLKFTLKFIRKNHDQNYKQKNNEKVLSINYRILQILNLLNSDKRSILLSEHNYICDNISNVFNIMQT